MSRIRGECNICGENLIVECDVSTDDDSPIRGKQRADYFSYCPNKCHECGEHKDENGKCDCKEVSIV